MEWCPGCGTTLVLVGGRAPYHLRYTTAGWGACPCSGRLWAPGCTAAVAGPVVMVFTLGTPRETFELEARRWEYLGYRFKDRYLPFAGCAGSRIIVDVVYPEDAPRAQISAVVAFAELWGKVRTQALMENIHPPGVAGSTPMSAPQWWPGKPYEGALPTR